MKKTFFAMAVAIAMMITGSAQAEGIESVVDSCCSCGGNWSVGAEIPFLRFHAEGGVSNAAADETDFDSSFRGTVAYTRCDGLGLRLRYWTMDQQSNTAGVFDVDTYTLDIEAFQAYQLDCSTTVELSAGLRYNDYEMNAAAGAAAAGLLAPVDFDGYGMIVGARVDRDLCWATAYTSYRFAILMDDVNVNNVALIDHKVGHHELQSGLAKTYCMGCYDLTVNAGVELSNWAGYAGARAQGAVGWGGYVIGATLNF